MYDIIFAYLKEGYIPKDLTKNKRDALRRKCKNFIVKSDGLLYFKDKRKEVEVF